MPDGTHDPGSSDSPIDFDVVQFSWDVQVPENSDEIEKRVRVDCKENLWGLGRPDDLIFHTVFLGASIHDPHIFVIGCGDGFVMTYVANPSWGSVDE